MRTNHSIELMHGSMSGQRYTKERVVCCQRCGRFVFGRSAHVHHVIPIKEDSTLKLEENNLRLLCPVCHTIEENEDKPKKFFRVILEAPIKN